MNDDAELEMWIRQSEARKELWKTPKRGAIPDGMRRCAMCGELLRESEFYVKAKRCKPCHRAYAREWQRRKTAAARYRERAR